jgi:saccharopine dehydrogenase-like NADP-dependent oxidoreductase
MKILLVGAGGVGDAFCAIASRRSFVESIVVADIDPVRAAQVAGRDGRFTPFALDASDAAAVTAALVGPQDGAPALRAAE